METITISFMENFIPYYEESSVPIGDSEYGTYCELDKKHMVILSYINGKIHIKVSKSFMFFLRIDVIAKDNTCSTQFVFDSHSVHEPDDNNNTVCINYDKNKKVKIFFSEQSFNVELYHILNGEKLEQDPEYKDRHYFNDVVYFIYG